MYAQHAILAQGSVHHGIITHQRSGVGQRALPCHRGCAGLHHHARLAGARGALHGGTKAPGIADGFGKHRDHAGVGVVNQMFHAIDIADIGLIAGGNHETETDAALLRAVENGAGYRTALRDKADVAGQQGALEQAGRAEQIDARVAVEVAIAVGADQAHAVLMCEGHESGFFSAARCAGFAIATADDRHCLDALGAAVGKRGGDLVPGDDQQRGIDRAGDRAHTRVAGQAGYGVEARVDRIDRAAARATRPTRADIAHSHPARAGSMRAGPAPVCPIRERRWGRVLRPISAAQQILDKAPRHAVARSGIKHAAAHANDGDTARIEERRKRAGH